jgi:hypothetical protein
MVQLTLQGQTIEGTPLAWDRSQVKLLGRDGRLWTFPPDEVADFQPTASRFQSYSVSELRSALLRELGGGLEVSGTGHYLVVHLPQQGDRWGERLEGLYRSLVRYFWVRGFQPAPPPLPLVAVVCRDRAEFVRYARGHAQAMPAGVVGYYDLKSNRIVVYDMGGAGSSASWQQNAAVLIHEATHQTAFNTGLHSRLAPPPLWLAEGLATLFEAPGVFNSDEHPQAAERINRGRFEQFQLYRPRHRPEWLLRMIAGDEFFRQDAARAYADAWALTFYLTESEPQKYVRYLLATARRPPLSEPTAAERLAEFTAVFGGDWQMLEARLLRFMAQWK